MQAALRASRSTLRASRSAISRGLAIRARGAATQAQKRAGDISDAFVSLSGRQFAPLAPEYADLKGRLIKGHEAELRHSWERLLQDLREEIPIILELGSKVIPEIDFNDIGNASETFKQEHRKRGVAVVRGVVPQEEALRWKEDLREYIAQNPHTKAFPPEKPQVFELYWSPTQLRARAHPNLLATHRFLMSFWHSKDPAAAISTSSPTSYADRLRMRLPGDAKFALGPHVDGGSVERWDEQGYGRGGVYDSVWRGEWEKFDPWESSCRLPVISDMHSGVGACSMFRMYQGWLSMSTCGPFEGTLLVNPLLAKATAYYLLRPFFSPRKGVELGAQTASETITASSDFLASDNWVLDPIPTSWLQGATPGHGQELSPLLHPHLDLNHTMVHIPTVRPGDYVAWHCDTIHAVDKIHAGTSDSSVLYIPACPLTEENAKYLALQRSKFVTGEPSPDFGGGEGESKHVGRVLAEDMEALVGDEGCKAMGLKEWDSSVEGLTAGEKEAIDRANKALGFYI